MSTVGNSTKPLAPTLPRLPAMMAFADPKAGLAIRPSNVLYAAGGEVRQEGKVASVAGRLEPMAQAFAGNRVPTGTAQAPVDMLLRVSGFAPPSKNPSFGERFWGTDWQRVGAALRVAGASVNKPGLYKRDNPGFHYDEKSSSLYFANSKHGAQAFKSFMVKFTDLTTDRNGNYSEAAKQFIKEGLPLLTDQFGGTMVKALQNIAQELKADENSGPVRFLRTLGTVSNVLQQIAAVRGGGRGIAPQVVRGKLGLPGLVDLPRPVNSIRVPGSRPTKPNAGSSLTTTNVAFSAKLFADKTKIAEHFANRTFGSASGRSPTAYVYGGHAKSGPFSGLSGKTSDELVASIDRRCDELQSRGLLRPLGEGTGNKNRTYIYEPTGQIVRVGSVTSEELSATASFSRMYDKGVGAKVDLGQSLYVPEPPHSYSMRSYGTAVLMMERVSGQPLSISSPGNFSNTVPAKVADGLVHIHTTGRAHDDLVRRNIMFDPATGEVRLIDFGLSRRTTNIKSDLMRLAQAESFYGKTSSSPVIQRTRDLYRAAVDRLPGPDRSAALYQRNPDLYAKHLDQFEARKNAMKANLDNTEFELVPTKGNF